MDIIVKFVTNIVVALATGIANFVGDAAGKLFALGCVVLAVLVAGFLLWRGIALVQKYKRP